MNKSTHKGLKICIFFVFIWCIAQKMPLYLNTAQANDAATKCEIIASSVYLGIPFLTNQSSLSSIWGTSLDNIFVTVSWPQGMILHYDGTSWYVSYSRFPFSPALDDVWESSGKIYAVYHSLSGYDIILNYLNSYWMQEPFLSDDGSYPISRRSGNKNEWYQGNSHYVVGESGEVLRNNEPVDISVTNNLNAIWGYQGNLFIVGDEGALIYIAPPPPEIALIQDQESLINTSHSFEYTIVSQDYDINQINFSLSSSNSQLVPNLESNMHVSMLENNCWLSLTPTSDAIGDSIISITATDPVGMTATTQFLFSVYQLFSLTSTSGYGGTITPQGVNQIKNNQDQTYFFQPNYGYGVDTITVNGQTISLTDTQYTLSNIMSNYTIHAMFKRIYPTAITPISNQTILEDSVSDPIHFTISNAEQGPITITIHSNQTTLLPNESAFTVCYSEICSNNAQYTEIQMISMEDTANVSIRIHPDTNLNGTAVITLMVIDSEGITASTPFMITVTEINDPPSIDSIPEQEIIENTSTEWIELFVQDPDNSTFTFWATSSNPSLITSSDIQFNIQESARWMQLTPKLYQYGEAIISIWVSDGTLSAYESFNLIVQPNRIIIHGQITYYSEDKPVPNVTVNAYGPYTTTALTDENGYYTLSNLIPGNYTILPVKNDPSLTELSSMDVSRIARYSIGLLELTDLEKLSADVTLNSGISATDAARVARYSIGLLSSLNTFNQNWIFISTEWDYNTLWPLDLKVTKRMLENQSADLMNQDFKSIRLGDVTGNWE